MIDIEVPENCLVAFNQMSDGVAHVARITITDGVLMQVARTGETQIVAPGQWENVQIWPDPDYVAPEPVLEAPVHSAYAIQDEPLKYDPTVEPEEGWLDDEQAELYMEVMKAHDGDVFDTWREMRRVGLPLGALVVHDDDEEGARWTSIAAVARRLRPVEPATIDDSTFEGPSFLVLRDDATDLPAEEY